MSRTYSIEELATHARTIAIAFKVELQERDIPYHESCCLTHWERRSLRPVELIVRVRSIHTEKGYAIAMHELGHVLHPNGMLPVEMAITASRALKIYQEECAYEWARANALCWTPEMQEAERFGLWSHGVRSSAGTIEELTSQYNRAHQPPKQHAGESIADFMKRSRR